MKVFPIDPHITAQILKHRADVAASKAALRALQEEVENSLPDSDVGEFVYSDDYKYVIIKDK